MSVEGHQLELRLAAAATDLRALVGQEPIRLTGRLSMLHEQVLDAAGHVPEVAREAQVFGQMRLHYQHVNGNPQAWAQVQRSALRLAETVEAELAAVLRYHVALAQGLSDYEAREEGWPS